jgi:hypothetical protein
MADRELVPVFIPPLAFTLREVERQNGRALTAEDVEQVREQATCMMMPLAEAKALAESRGFRDVDPEDVWADWHRLKVQVTGRGYLPKIVLCVVGDARFAERAEALLTREKVEHEVRDADPRMPEAFEASASRLEPSFGFADAEAVEQHTHVVYALSANFGAGAAIEVSRRFFGLGAHLLDLCGGAAMKCDSSGIAHGRAKWLVLARDAVKANPAIAMPAAVRAFVRHPIGDDTHLWTCGMHLLGRPDLTIEREVIDEGEAARLFDAFAVYLLAECGDERHFASGHTFRADESSPRFRVTWEPCDGYAEDDLFFNSFGRYRFEKA